MKKLVFSLLLMIGLVSTVPVSAGFGGINMAVLEKPIGSLKISMPDINIPDLAKTLEGLKIALPNIQLPNLTASLKGINSGAFTNLGALAKMPDIHLPTIVNSLGNLKLPKLKVNFINNIHALSTNFKIPGKLLSANIGHIAAATKLGIPPAKIGALLHNLPHLKMPDLGSIEFPAMAKLPTMGTIATPSIATPSTPKIASLTDLPTMDFTVDTPTLPELPDIEIDLPSFEDISVNIEALPADIGGTFKDINANIGAHITALGNNLKGHFPPPAPPAPADPTAFPCLFFEWKDKKDITTFKGLKDTTLHFGTTTAVKPPKPGSPVSVTQAFQSEQCGKATPSGYNSGMTVVTDKKGFCGALKKMKQSVTDSTTGDTSKEKTVDVISNGQDQVNTGIDQINAAINTTLPKAQAQMAGAVTKVNDAKTTIAAGTTKLTTAKTKIATADTKITTADGKITAADTKLKAADTKIETADTTITHDNATVKEQALKVGNELTSVETELTKAQEAETKLPASIKSLQSVQSVLKLLQGLLCGTDSSTPPKPNHICSEALLDKMGELTTTDLVKLQSDTSSYLELVEMFSPGSITAAQGNSIVAALPAINTALSQIPAVKPHVGNLQNVLTALGAFITTLQTSLASLPGTITKIEGAQTQLKAAQAKLATIMNVTIPGAEAKIAAAKVKIADAQDKVNAAKVKIAAAKVKIATANTEITNAGNTIIRAKYSINSAIDSLNTAEDSINTAQNTTIPNAISSINSALPDLQGAERLIHASCGTTYISKTVPSAPTPLTLATIPSKYTNLPPEPPAPKPVAAPAA